jgi:hypothetical protein
MVGRREVRAASQPEAGDTMHRRSILSVAALAAAAIAIPAVHAQPASTGSGQATSTGSGQATSTGSGQAWPGKPITYIVPFGAGGTTDVLARLVTPKAGAALGTSFVIENKAGAGGSMGSDFTAKAAPDGYTIQGGTISSHAINVSLYAKLPTTRSRTSSRSR